MVRLNVTQLTTKSHTGTALSAGWSRTNELYSCADDGTIVKWSVNGEPLGVVSTFEECKPIILRFSPQSGRNKDDDKFVVGCSDGSFRFCSAVTGREEQKVEAHVGACCALAWNSDGSALVSSGEDGLVKVWSAMGKLRHNLYNTGVCVYSICWNGDGTDVLFPSGRDLIIKPERSGAKHLQWRAHDGLVQQVDWSSLNGNIVSCGEDCKFKVWDSFGRNLFVSNAAELPITSVRFSPDGDMFAVGGYGHIRVCDNKGWTLCREQTARPPATENGTEQSTGSILDVAWGFDNCILAGATSEGAVVFGQLVDRVIEYRECVAIQTQPMSVTVHNVITDTPDELPQRDKVVRMAMSFGHLVLATTSQVFVYQTDNLKGTPHVFDVKEIISLILMTSSSFLTLDMQSGLRIFDYSGTLISSLRPSSVRLDTLNKNLISLSPDTVCVRDSSEHRRLLFLEVQSGRTNPNQPPYMHSNPIQECAVNHFGTPEERKAVIIDKNRDLYVLRSWTDHAGKQQGAGTSAVDANGVPILDPTRVRILASMVSSVQWCQVAHSDSLVALADHQLVTFYHPGIVFIDVDLLAKTKQTRKDATFDMNDTIELFVDTRAQVRRGADGAILTYGTSPYPGALFEFLQNKQWAQALRLCRFVKDQTVWAILAAHAIQHSRFYEAQDAYSALHMAPKVDYIREGVMKLPSAKARAAELALFQRRPKDAEQMLVSAGLIYRAIEMYVNMYRWDDALRLALAHKTHIDTVLAFRQRALARMGKTETHSTYLEFMEGVEIDENAIEEKIAQEKAREDEMGKPLDPDEPDGDEYA